MIRRTSLQLVIAVGLSAIGVSAAGAARAEDASAAIQSIQAGHQAMLAKDYDTAIRQYTRAKEAASGNPEVFYYLASARMAKGDYDQAASDFHTAIEVAGAKRADLHAKCMFCLALLEEWRSKWAAAKSAWQEYITFANTHKDVKAFVENAQTRIKVIEARDELERSYQAVRDRIAEREAKKGSKGDKKRIVGSGN